jgi:hypothetical protein
MAAATEVLIIVYATCTGYVPPNLCRRSLLLDCFERYRVRSQTANHAKTVTGAVTADPLKAFNSNGSVWISDRLTSIDRQISQPDYGKSALSELPRQEMKKPGSEMTRVRNGVIKESWSVGYAFLLRLAQPPTAPKAEIINQAPAGNGTAATA